ncbi:pyruvate dehydrogenase (acetyl-transferring) E1 component subunit alpha [Anaerotignum sp.]|uniref:pyruvate dehydrogenase (acetyl-transferring) E1 component subunit alpha n=1 Tax=Anaerotignum sp. TaxID=2039241 RepID=UPI002714D99D|nr:pyruvate dehydrogenase (acetyl-transferring) E1 component subunit alpha [Anaerotignum sp.]
MKVPKEVMKDMYLRMLRIREFESKAQTLFADGRIPGFVHLYLGEEAVATGVCACLSDEDYITSTHRGHGHIVAKGGDLKFMMAELYGKATGYCKGKGGSMHIADRDKGILGANGIVGAGHNIAVGAGLSAQYRETDQVCICFFGDASTNQGTFHESINLASVWKLPIVFVCENNNYGISMSQSRHQAIKDVADRGAAYGIPGIAVDGNDVLAVYEAASEAVARARKGQGPTLVECKTYRWRGHFEGDPGNYKPKEEQAAWLKKDPIPRFEAFLKENGILSEKELTACVDQVKNEIKEAIQFAEESPDPDVASVVQDIYSDIVEEARVR